MVLTTTTLALRRNYRLSSIRLDTGVELAIGEVVISLNFEISFFLSKYIRPFSNSKFWGVCVCPSYFDAERESARYVLHLTTFLLLVFNIYNRPGPLFFSFSLHYHFVHSYVPHYNRNQVCPLRLRLSLRNTFDFCQLKKTIECKFRYFMPQKPWFLLCRLGRETRPLMRPGKNG